MGGSDVKWNNLITPFPIKRKKETKTKKQNGKNIKQKTKKRYHIRVNRTRVTRMVVHFMHPYTIHAITLGEVLNDIINPFFQQVWIQSKFSLKSVMLCDVCPANFSLRLLRPCTYQHHNAFFVNDLSLAIISNIDCKFLKIAVQNTIQSL